MDTHMVKYRFTIGDEFLLQVNEGDSEWHIVYAGGNLPELIRDMADLVDEEQELTVEQRIHALRVLPRGITELVRKNLFAMEDAGSHWGAGDPSLSISSKLEEYQSVAKTRAAIWLLDQALE